MGGNREERGVGEGGRKVGEEWEVFEHAAKLDDS